MLSVFNFSMTTSCSSNITLDEIGDSHVKYMKGSSVVQPCCIFGTSVLTFLIFFLKKSYVEKYIQEAEDSLQGSTS